MKSRVADSLQGLGIEDCSSAAHLKVPPTETGSKNVNIGYIHTHVCVCVCVPVVHVPEELQVELVDTVADLLPVALHQLCVVHQLLLHTHTKTYMHTKRFSVIF